MATSSVNEAHLETVDPDGDTNPNAVGRIVRRLLGWQRTADGTLDTDATLGSLDSCHVLEPTAPSAQQAKDAADFVDRLKRLLPEHATVAAGRLKVIGLEPIRNKLGEDWQRYADRALAIIRQTLAKRLCPYDVYYEHPDLKYAVIFPTLTEAQAKLKCAFICREICEKLFGTDNTEDFFAISSITIKQNGEVAIVADDCASAILAENPVVAEEGRRRRKPADDPKWVSIDAGAMALDPFIATLEFAFQPMWNLRHKSIGTYLCVPCVPADNGCVLTGYNVLPPDPHPEALCKLDLAGLQHAFDALDDSAPSPYLVATLVHFETLAARRRRTRFLQRCHEATEKQRQNLILEVVGLPVGAPNSTVLQLICALTPICRSVLLRLPLEGRSFNQLRTVPIHGVGMDLADAALDERQLFQLFDSFCEKAEHGRLKTFLHNVPSYSLISAAYCAGFDFLDSDLAAPIHEHPQGVRAFGLVDLYRG